MASLESLLTFQADLLRAALHETSFQPDGPASYLSTGGTAVNHFQWYIYINARERKGCLQIVETSLHITTSWVCSSHSDVVVGGYRDYELIHSSLPYHICQVLLLLTFVPSRRQAVVLCLSWWGQTQMIRHSLWAKKCWAKMSKTTCNHLSNPRPLCALYSKHAIKATTHFFKCTYRSVKVPARSGAFVKAHGQREEIYDGK